MCRLVSRLRGEMPSIKQHVTEQDIGVVVDHGVLLSVVLARELLLGERHADCVG